MDSLKDRLRQASAEYESLESLESLVRERVPHPVEAMRGLLRRASETDSNGGRAWVLAKAVWLAGHESRRDGTSLEETLCSNLSNLVGFDPELPGLVADAVGVLEALLRAAPPMFDGGKQSQWLGELHEAFVLLKLVAPTGKKLQRSDAWFEATKKMLERHAEERKDINPGPAHAGLLALLVEHDY